MAGTWADPDEDHIFVHEAGHAVAAIEKNIDFLAVRFYDESSAPRFGSDGGYAAAAVVMPDEDQASWVMPDPLGSLHFVLAGVMAERAVFGTAIEGGFDEDLRQWRRGCGMTDQQTPVQLDEFLGKPFLDVVQEVEDWAGDNRKRISSLSERMRAAAPNELTRDDVQAHLTSFDGSRE